MVRLLKDVMYEGEQYYVFQSSYHNGKPAIILHPDKEFYQSPEQIVMSVNLDDTEFDEVAIKDSDYYYGQYQFLIDEGVITPTKKKISSGYNTYPVGQIITD